MPRLILSTTRHPNRIVMCKEQEAVLKIFLATVHHYFGSVSWLFASITDPRQPALITYPLAALLVTGLLLFVCQLGARRQITHKLRGDQASADKFETLFGVAQCPHGDTLEAAFRRLQPAALQAVVSGMTETLIRRTHRPTPPAAGTWASANSETPVKTPVFSLSEICIVSKIMLDIHRNCT